MKTFKELSEAFKTKSGKEIKIKGYKVRYQTKGKKIDLFVDSEYVGQFKDEKEALKNAKEFIQFMDKSK